MINYPKSADEFDELLKGELVLVDFFTTWCGPCKMLGEELISLDHDNVPGLLIVKVDAEEVTELSRRYRIQAVPTLMLFKSGELVKHTNGYHDKSELLKFIEK